MARSLRTCDRRATGRAALRGRICSVILTLTLSTPFAEAFPDETAAAPRGAQSRPQYGSAVGLKAPYLAAATDGGARESDLPSPATSQSSSSVRLNGFVQAEIARTIADPEHWSKARTRAELSAQGRVNADVKWKLGARLDYDAVYDLGNFYPPDVRKDQRLNLMARENYLDVSAGGWDFRLGRQHVIWGEVVGFFVADVVSAKDMREFLLPEFDLLRIPQWAARAEYSGNAFHAELLWIPVQTYDKIGKPGAEFFPVPPPGPPGFTTVIRDELRPSRTPGNGSYGTRLSTLQHGWDVSAFYYRSMDSAPTFSRQISLGPQPAIIYQPRHDRIHQLGSTVTKDLGDIVFKAEAVHTRGRQFNVTRVAEVDGVVPQDTVDWVGGLDFTLPANTRLNVQLFQRMFFDHDPDTLAKRRETGYSVYLTHELSDRLEAQVLWISSLDRSDWLLRPRLVWKIEQNLRLTSGIDLFHGPQLGVFGKFANRDRAYAEMRYSF